MPVPGSGEDVTWMFHSCMVERTPRLVENVLKNGIVGMEVKLHTVDEND